MDLVRILKYCLKYYLVDLQDWRIGEENDVAAESKILTPVYTQNLPANSRAMLIRDTGNC